MSCSPIYEFVLLLVVALQQSQALLLIIVLHQFLLVLVLLLLVIKFEAARWGVDGDVHGHDPGVFAMHNVKACLIVSFSHLLQSRACNEGV